HQRVDVAVGQDNEARLQGRQDNVFQLVGKIGRVKEAQGGPAQNVSLLRLFEFLAHQGRAFQSDLQGGVTASFQPFDERGNLRRAPRAISAFDDDEFAS